jgi:hypothetical protein
MGNEKEFLSSQEREQDDTAHSGIPGGPEKGKYVGLHLTDIGGPHEENSAHSVEELWGRAVAQEVKAAAFQEPSGFMLRDCVPGGGCEGREDFLPAALLITYYRAYPAPLGQQSEGCLQAYIAGGSSDQNHVVSVHVSLLISPARAAPH